MLECAFPDHVSFWPFSLLIPESRRREVGRCGDGLAEALLCGLTSWNYSY
jgi:hypothetical protein